MLASFVDQRINSLGLHCGRAFQGEFFEDQKNGVGTFKYADGDVFHGVFRNGQKEGQGCYAFVDGDQCK